MYVIHEHYVQRGGCEHATSMLTAAVVLCRTIWGADLLRMLGTVLFRFVFDSDIGESLEDCGRHRQEKPPRGCFYASRRERWVCWDAVRDKRERQQVIGGCRGRGVVCLVASSQSTYWHNGLTEQVNTSCFNNIALMMSAV